jgi:hypothetical protein
MDIHTIEGGVMAAEFPPESHAGFEEHLTLTP